MKNMKKMVLIVVTILLVLPLPLMVSCSSPEEAPDTKVIRDLELVNFNESASIVGNLGGGFFSPIKGEVKEADQYEFYYKTNDGYKKTRVLADATTIHEDDSVTPHCVVTYVRVGKKIHGTLDEKDCYYDIYVPTGTVSRK